MLKIKICGSIFASLLLQFLDWLELLVTQKHPKLHRKMAPKIWNIHYIGPTCVGKGWETEQLNDYLKKEHSKSLGIMCVGDLVRERFERDQGFKDLYETSVSKGNLVPDPIIIPMFDGRFAEVRDAFSIRLDDGFCRTVRQVKHAENLGLLGVNSVTFLLHASKSTCHARALDRQARKKNGKRFDEDAFEDRFAFHQRTIGQIHTALRATKTHIIQVDADRHLQHEVIHDIVAGVEGLMGSHFEPVEGIPLQRAFIQMAARHRQGQPALTTA